MDLYYKMLILDQILEKYLFEYKQIDVNINFNLYMQGKRVKYRVVFGKI